MVPQREYLSHQNRCIRKCSAAAQLTHISAGWQQECRPTCKTTGASCAITAQSMGRSGHSACQRAGKTRIFTLSWKSFGKSRLNGLRAMIGLRRGLGLAIGMSVICVAVPAAAQENLDLGRTPSQLFASNCAICHKSVEGLSKTVGLKNFLREHYTASKNRPPLLPPTWRQLTTGLPSLVATPASAVCRRTRPNRVSPIQAIATLIGLKEEILIGLNSGLSQPAK